LKVLRNNRVIQEYTPTRGRGGWHGPPSDTGPRILEEIRRAEKQGETPTIRELRARCGISSTSVVEYHLRQMAADGDLILGARGTSRSYRLTEQGRGYPDDADLLARCLAYFEQELGATGGPLMDDLRARLS
jgi:hypothetical protein